MGKDLIIKELISVYCDGNSSQFAQKLGVKPSTISTWISRKTFDVDLIFAKCEGVSAEWLLTGKGEMFRQNVQKDVNSTPQKLPENQRTFANIQENTGISNDKNVTSLIRILENTIVEKDKQIEKLLDIIEKGNVQ